LTFEKIQGEGKEKGERVRKKRAKKGGAKGGKCIFRQRYEKKSRRNKERAVSARFKQSFNTCKE